MKVKNWVYDYSGHVWPESRTIAQQICEFLPLGECPEAFSDDFYEYLSNQKGEFFSYYNEASQAMIDHIEEHYNFNPVT